MKMRLILPLLFLTFALSNAEEEYSLSLKEDLPITTIALMTEGFGSYLYSRMEIPDHVMDKDHLLPWDKKLAGRYSETADRMSDIGSVGAIAPFAVGLFAQYTGNSSWKEFGTFSLMFTQALLLQSGINLAVRSLEIWPRPYLYSESEKGKDVTKNAKAEAYGSFFSGHASAAFTVAVFTSEWFNSTHPKSTNKGIVRAFAFSMASLESALRVAAGKHYPSDVVIGGLVGTAVSYGILFMHKKRNEKFSLWVTPTAAGFTIAL